MSGIPIRMVAGGESSSYAEKVIAIVAYSICSSTLLLSNKFALEHLPVPSVVSFIQIASSTLIVFALKYFGNIHVDDLEWVKMKPFILYVFLFVSSIYANMKALQLSNVETVIVFRACTPIAVALIEYLFMNRTLPNIRSCLSLVIVASGAIVYCLSDSQFRLQGLGAYSWVTLYFLLITLEMTYGKLLTEPTKNSMGQWGPVLYQNLLATLPMFLLGYSYGDYNNIDSLLGAIDFNGYLVLLFSCVVGTLIGYTSWLCRGMLSAASFTLVGVVNKFLTVLLNVLLWDKHSSPAGLFAVCLCLGAGTFYQQAPKREVVVEKIDIESSESLVKNESSIQ